MSASARFVARRLWPVEQLWATSDLSEAMSGALLSGRVAGGRRRSTTRGRGSVHARLLIVLAVLGAMLVVASPASSVQYGEPDVNNEYPWVGLMVAYDEDWNPLWRCSGSLLSRDLFLTAAHCVEEPAAHIAIWFDYDLTAATHPAYPDPDDAD